MLSDNGKKWYLPVSGVDVEGHGSNHDDLEQNMLELSSSAYSLTALNRSLIGLSKSTVSLITPPNVFFHFIQQLLVGCHLLMEI